MAFTKNFLLVLCLPYILKWSLSKNKNELNFLGHLTDYQEYKRKKTKVMKLRVEVSNWLAIFLMTSYQILLKFL
jgi:hypothetical protein